MVRLTDRKAVAHSLCPPHKIGRQWERDGCKMESGILAVIVFVEVIFTVWAFVSGIRHDKEKAAARLAELLLLLLLLGAGVLKGFSRYGMLVGILALQAVIGAAAIHKRGEKPFKAGKQLAGLIMTLLLYGMALFPAFLFPQYKEPAVTGSHQVAVSEYTWVDESRIETYSDTGENRALTVKFWYPEEEGSYPLVIFSHGAFGIIDSNYSTCKELASNGYVAVSIGHPYHAMFVEDVNGKVTIADMGFINEVYEDNGTGDPAAEERNYNKSRKWMEIRTADENFVLDTILEKAKQKEGAPFTLINSEKIGLFGHSMGGASSVALGRQREDIGAVINLEGTMLSEYTGFENGAIVYNEEPYPVPLLDVNSREVYEQAAELEGMEYVNFYVGEHAEEFESVVIEDAGHLNFTDLPLVSPVLAKLLGVGTADARECIENVNRTVLDFFNEHLKNL